MLILSHDQVLAVLRPDACAQAMREILIAHARGQAHMPLRMVSAPPGAAGMLAMMPAWQGETGEHPSCFSLKALCLIPDNPARGLDTHQGLVTLFDGRTGVPLAALEASAVTAVRTAAVSAVATAALAREDARVLAVLGAGVQARAHLRALARVRRFARVRVYAPTREHARAALAEMDREARGSVAAEAAPSARHAVEGADVIVTATSSSTPVLEHAWIAPGAHINAVGASTPGARELPVETLAAAALFADSRESLRQEAGDFRAALERGLIDEQHVRGELGQVLAGTAPGRREAGEITLFRSLGLAVEDLAAARLALGEAARRGIGTEVKL